MFFTDERLSFFKPLTSKYREQIVQCLCLLYQRQYSAFADYGHSLNREQLLEILEEALAKHKDIILDDEEAEGTTQRFKNHREQANWVLNQLLQAGWLEKQVDPATFQSTFPFSRMGRIFSHSLLASDNTQVRTRHRNTRNTLNALNAFSNQELGRDVYDLLDAFEYSESIITDFTDVISELEERKRELVKEVESQQLVQDATDQFFDYMEKRFQPDIQVRLSADSVEKHREDISNVITKIRNKDKEFKAAAERECRRLVPDLCAKERSSLMFILDQIEQRMRDAADIMLPALRSALHSFTKRADIIIRQLSYLNTHQNNDLLDVCKELCDLNEDDFKKRMGQAAEAMTGISVGLIDPESVRLQARRHKLVIDSSVVEHHEINIDGQRELMVQQLLDQAFSINNTHVREYVMSSLRQGKRLSTRELPISDAKDLLAMAHVIEVGAVNSINAGSSDLQFKVSYTGKRVKDNEFYEAFDEFTIELIEQGAQDSAQGTGAVP
ncbi:MAG: flagellar protein FliT [Pseudomonadales bacterium]|nr:flagellar protein FliT [Pseudomonadales bacterium]